MVSVSIPDVQARCILRLLQADCIVATPEVEFRLPEISIGLIPGAGGTQRLTAAIGKYRVCLSPKHLASSYDSAA